jgi:hypothetical protein
MSAGAAQIKAVAPMPGCVAGAGTTGYETDA